MKARISDAPATARALIDAWFTMRGWKPWDFQREVWDSYARGEDGLVRVATGAGKTYAGVLGPLMELIDEWLASDVDVPRGATTTRARARAASAFLVEHPGPRLLYVTPLRAVTRDIEKAIREPIDAVGATITVESRTGDTSASIRSKQRERLPHVLLTTPESLCLLLTREDARSLFATLRCVVLDEWHELLVSKRGSATELALARLRRFAPSVRTWGLSATIPNADEALCALRGTSPTTSGGRIVTASIDRPIRIETVLPRHERDLPWAGHLGLSMLPAVLDELDPDVPTLVFTNTRSQAERWFHAISFERPQWQGVMALHHGSIDREERERVEAGLKDGTLRIVVATSSLDLGVDFAPIRKVLQIGSPKGIARVVQRAGRANHATPGGESVVRCVPTHALELLEIVASRRAALAGEIEARVGIEKPIDVLMQHLVSCAIGGGFDPEAMYEEACSAWSFRSLTREEFAWALRMVESGGVLGRYPEFRKIMRERDGMYRATDARTTRQHRLNIGTITGDATLEIRYASGRRIGTIDEHFIANLRVGSRFVFAGKVLEFVGVRDLIVIARPARGTTGTTPIWAGTRLPLSESLSSAMRVVLREAAEAADAAPLEIHAAQVLIRTQSRLSVVPGDDEVLIERTRSREGMHVFVFPFEGRLVHAGLAALIAMRCSRLAKGTFTLAVNDYGIELLTGSEGAWRMLGEVEAWRSLLHADNLLEDVASSVSMSQLARLAFRDVARVAGMVNQNYPGARRTGKQVQASSGLIFDVLSDVDPEHLLLHQARREVLDRHFEASRLVRSLERLHASTLRIVTTERFTPLSYPLVVEREASTVSSQTIAERLGAMRAEWDGEAAGR